jgi:hypothetical protein
VLIGQIGQLSIKFTLQPIDGMVSREQNLLMATTGAENAH